MLDLLFNMVIVCILRCILNSEYACVRVRVCKTHFSRSSKVPSLALKKFPPTQAYTFEYTHTDWPSRLIRGTIPLFGSVIQRLTLPASTGILLLLVLEVGSPTSLSSPLRFKISMLYETWSDLLKKKKNVCAIKKTAMLANM